MTRKTLLISAMLVLIFLMVTSVPKWVNTTQAADIDAYIQIVRNLNTPYEEELVNLLTQLHQYLYQGNMEQAKEIGNQLNQILDKLPKDQRDALTMGGCSKACNNAACGNQDCKTENCTGYSECGCDSKNEPYCFCSRNGNCEANCKDGKCTANGNDDEITLCFCKDCKGKGISTARMPLASTIGILILIALIIGSGIWLWRRKRISVVT